MAAARGIAEVVTDDELAEDYIIPSVFNRDVAAERRPSRGRRGEGGGTGPLLGGDWHLRGRRRRRGLVRRRHGLRDRTATLPAGTVDRCTERG